jgi:hypothetical protein
MNRRSVAQLGSALALGARCRGFKSLHSDHLKRISVFSEILLHILCLYRLHRSDLWMAPNMLDLISGLTFAI